MQLPKSWLTNVSTVTKTGGAKKVTNVVCAVWVCPPPARTHSNCEKKNTSSTATTHPTTNSSTSHPTETTTMKMGVLVALPAWGYLLLSSASAHIIWRIVLPEWYSVCCFTGRTTFAPCLILSLPRCICSRNWRDSWYSAWSPSSPLTRASQLCSSSFWMSFEEHLILVYFVFSKWSTHPSKKIFCLVIGSAIPSFVHHRKWSSIVAQFIYIYRNVWSSDVSWRWPRWTCSGIRSCTSRWMTWQPFSIVTWAFFSCAAVNLPHLQKTVPVVSTLFLGRRMLLFTFFLSEPLCSVLEVDDLLEGLGRNCVVAQDTPVRCLIEFQRILRCFQISHKQSVMRVLHVEVGLVLRVGVGSNGDTNEKCAVFFCLCFFPDPHGTSPSDFIESSCLENPMWYSNDAYHFSVFLWKSVDVSRFSPDWPCGALMYASSSRWKLVWMFWYYCWPVTCHPSFQQTSDLPFCVWLVNFPRIWFGVGPLIMSGLSSTAAMYSLQGSAPVLSRFPTCLVNRAVFLDKADCVVSGRSFEREQ